VGGWVVGWERVEARVGEGRHCFLPILLLLKWGSVKFVGRRGGGKCACHAGETKQVEVSGSVGSDGQAGFC
jgi:hypothetical protein